MCVVRAGMEYVYVFALLRILNMLINQVLLVSIIMYSRNMTTCVASVTPLTSVSAEMERGGVYTCTHVHMYTCTRVHRTL